MDDCIDEIRRVKWRRWQRGIFRALARTRQLGMRTRGASSDRGDVFGSLFSDLAAYQALAATRLGSVSRRDQKRFLARQRKEIREAVRRIRRGGDRVWWFARRDRSGVDVLITNAVWPQAMARPASPKSQAHHVGGGARLTCSAPSRPKRLAQRLAELSALEHSIGDPHGTVAANRGAVSGTASDFSKIKMTQ